MNRGITLELTRRRDFNSSFRLHPSSLHFTLPALESNELLDFARRYTLFVGFTFASGNSSPTLLASVCVEITTVKALSQPIFVTVKLVEQESRFVSGTVD